MSDVNFCVMAGHFLEKVTFQGRIQDFQIEGAQKIMCTHRTSRA